MNSTEIAKKIESPYLCSPNDKADLEVLVQKYPYAQTFPILLLKTLSQAKDLHFEEALHQHAFRISDRMHLYYLINEVGEEVASSELQVASSDDVLGEVSNSEFRVESLDDENEAETEIVRLEYDELINEDFKFAKVEEMTFEPVQIGGAKEEVGSSGAIVQEVASSELRVASSDHVMAEVESSELQVAGSDDALEEVACYDDNVEDQESFDEEMEDEPEESAFDEQEEVSVGLAMELFDPTVDLSALPTVEELSILNPSSFEQEKKSISLDLIEKRFDSEVDELTSNAIAQGFHITLEDNKEAEGQLEIPKETSTKPDPIETIEKFEQNNFDEKRSFSAWLHANETTTSKEVEDVKIDRSLEIIDKFIQEEPKISRSVKSDNIEEKKKTPFFKATEKAKESLQDNIIPVSSTLAKIFEAQGNYPKAIHSYEQLMLLYPEKKTFFANQIKELQKKLNS
ncbi:MAG: hypothetical protein WC044_05390 [Crocinitomicaceae bacterium]